MIPRQVNQGKPGQNGPESRRNQSNQGNQGRKNTFGEKEMFWLGVAEHRCIFGFWEKFIPALVTLVALVINGLESISTLVALVINGLEICRQ